MVRGVSLIVCLTLSSKYSFDLREMNPRLNLSGVPPTDLSMASRRYVKIAPFNTGINPVNFQIDPQEDFIDLNDSFIELEIVLKKNDGTNLAAGNRILPVNNLTHSLLKQMIMRLNGTLISPQTDTYHHKAFIEQILNNDRADGENLLPPQGWLNSLNVPDTADEALTRINSIRLMMITRHCQKKPEQPY